MNTGYHDLRFPTDISYGSRGGPGFSTEIVTSVSGYEQRNINWQQARARYNVAYGVRTDEQLHELLAFFRARRGRAYAFRFKDWTDYQVTDEVIGVGDDVTTQFQLTKTYISGTYGYTRTITHPIVPFVEISLMGTQITSGFSLEATGGIVTLDSPPAAGVAITATFPFDVPVRFDSDQLSATLETYGVNAVEDVPLIEVRP